MIKFMNIHTLKLILFLMEDPYYNYNYNISYFYIYINKKL